MDLRDRKALLKQMEKIAKAAALLMLEADLAGQSITKKGRIDLVTEVDMAVNQRLCEELSAIDGSIDIIAEEGVQDELKKPQARLAFVIDPIDGTTNFVHGVMHSAISIALYDKQAQECLIGLVYNPFRNECFTAVKDGGAFLNDSALAVSTTKKLVDSLICTGFAYDVNASDDNNFAEFSSIIKEVQGLRRFGAASLDLAYVAAGRFDGYFEHGLKFWDYAAGMLLVLESGGVAITYDGHKVVESSGHILAANPNISPTLLAKIKAARQKAGLSAVP